MIGRQQLLSPRKAHHLIEKPAGDIGIDQALAQATEIGLIQSGALQVHAEEPAKENVLGSL